MAEELFIKSKWQSISINENLIIDKVDKSYLMQMPEDSKYSGYRFKYPAKLIQNGVVNETVCKKLVYLPTFTIKLKKDMYEELTITAKEFINEIKLKATYSDKVHKVEAATKEKEFSNPTKVELEETHSRVLSDEELEYKKAHWKIDKKIDNRVVLYSDDAENLYVTFSENIEKVKSVEGDYYNLIDKAFDSFYINKCEAEEEASFIADNFYSNKSTEIYKSYLEELKKSYVDSDWTSVAKDINDFKSNANLENSKIKIANYKNERKYEKNVPYALANRKQWIVWKWEIIKDRATKVPYNPSNPTSKAQSNNSSTWGDYDTACKVARGKEFDGVGIMFYKGLMGIDFDHCITNGKMNQDKQDIINNINCYTEYSPSGDGVHILLFNKLPEGYRKTNKTQGIETYDFGRFFTFTGNVYEKHNQMKKKVDTEKAFNEFIDKYLKEDLFKSSGKSSINETLIYKRDIPEVTDEKLIGVISKSVYGENFKRMYYKNELPLDKKGNIVITSLKAKDTSADFNKLIENCEINEDLLKVCEQDQSGCDWYMAGILAKFCSSTQQMDRIFRSSAMMRDKWDRNINGKMTYGESVVVTRFNQIDVTKDWYYDPAKYRAKFRKDFIVDRKTKQVKIKMDKEKENESI